MTRKIFCIGMHKTGTTSLHDYLARAGLRSLHNTRRSMTLLGLAADNAGEEGDGRPRELAAAVSEEALARTVAQFDCFSDLPWPQLHARLDRSFPGSRYILTLRDPDEWLASMVNHFGGANTRMRQWVYGFGNPLRHRFRYLEVYERHNAAVREYFRGREDLLVIRLGEDDARIGAALHEFLSLEGPCAPFPASHRRR